MNIENFSDLVVLVCRILKVILPSVILQLILVILPNNKLPRNYYFTSILYRV